MEGTNSSGHKQDVGWKYCEMLKEDGKVHIKCMYCGKIFKGGGIFRFKEHLAGRKGGGPMCQRVQPEVRILMQQVLDAHSANQTRRHITSSTNNNNSNAPKSFVNPEPIPLAIDVDTPLPKRTTRQKKDLAWKYCLMLKNDDKVQIKCKYCGKVFKGGGIHRLKEHLAGRKGAAPICDQVPPDVRLLMQQNLKEVVERQKKKQKVIMENVNHAGTGTPPPPVADLDAFANKFDDSDDDDDDDDADADADADDDDDDEEYTPAPTSNLSTDEVGITSEKRKRGRPKTSAVVVQADPLVAVNLKIMDKPIHLTMGRFLYDIGANLDALDSIYFQRLMDMISSGVAAPSHHDLRGWILKNLVDEIKNDIDQYKAAWAKTGCSILVEEWHSESGRTLLNFLVDCPQGTVFLKSVDASDTVYSTDALYALLKQTVEEVGPSYVLQVITNGDEHNYVAGKRLMETFPSLYWAPCAARCIDIILEDFGKLDSVSKVIEEARFITRFIYNNSGVLNLMRRFTFGKDIVQQGLTRSATNFTMLQRLADFKLNLQNMVTSQEWMQSPYAKQPLGLAMLDVISNRKFWSDCISIIRLTSPLLRVLGIVSNKKKAAMGYVFAGMYHAKETIKKELVKREDYMVYWNIIDNRWDQQRHPPLHAAGFFLNPKFFYSIEGEVHNEVLSRVLDCIERLVPETDIQDKTGKELSSYKTAVGDLGRKIAIRARETMLPAEWWSTYGGACPNLSRLAIRILSQTCSSIGCKHNHIPFEKVYGTKNCLERQRLKDLIFVQYNLRLKEKVNENNEQITLDPISFDDINLVEDWIMQNDLCLEDEDNRDWMALVPPSSNKGSSVDEVQDLGAGFDDCEIFEGLKA